MNPEMIKEYRERVRPKLLRYLRAEDVEMRGEAECACPSCGKTATLMRAANEWYCLYCKKGGDVLDYARLQYPTREDWEQLEHICHQTGVRIEALSVISGEELAQMCFPPQHFLVEGLLPREGLFLLAAPAKTGKSWMVLQLAAALIRGEQFLDLPTDKTRVLYFSLEDHNRRLYERSRQMGLLGSPDILFATRAELLGKGFEQGVCRYLEKEEGIGLVIVDTLQKIREVGGDAYNYGRDYDVMNRLKAISQRFHIAVMLVHHTNKMEETGDEMNRVSGTTAMTGGVDATWVLRRPDRMQGDAVMQVSGRDAEDMRLKLRFDREKLRWLSLGPEEEAERPATLEAQLLRGIRTLVGEGEWAGTAGELLRQLNREEALHGLASNTLGRWLRKNRDLLWSWGVGMNEHREGNSKVLQFYRRRQAAG